MSPPSDARGGTRTHTPRRTIGFKPIASDQFRHPGGRGSQTAGRYPGIRRNFPSRRRFSRWATPARPFGSLRSTPRRRAGLRGRSPLLRLQCDERLVALIRRGNQPAFEALVARYQSRLLAFCRHMLSSREDAEDVLQEVFAAAFNAMLADDREINVRPWLYRIARNRSLNHLRRTQAVGMDSMDIHLSEGGLTTADKVHKREEFRLLIADVQDLPETQRTALLLREIDALSYDQIAEAMETTVPSVKSLLVRARVSLAEAAEARLLSCDEVRLELGEVAEGLTRTTAPVRRHLRTCDRCAAFKKQLRSTNRALAALYPVGPLILLKKLLLTHIGTGAAARLGRRRRRPPPRAPRAPARALQVGFSAFASKAAAGLAAAAIVTAGAVEVQHAAKPRARASAPSRSSRPPTQAAAAPAPVATAAAGPGRLRAAADRRPHRAQGQADQGDRAQDRRGQGHARRRKPTPTPTATPSATGRPRRRRPARARAATPRRCRPTRSAPPSPAAAPHAAAAAPTPSPGPVSGVPPSDADARSPTPSPTRRPPSSPRRPRRRRPRRHARAADPDAVADAHADPDAPPAPGRRTTTPARSVDPRAERHVGVGREQDHAALFVGGAQHQHLGAHRADLARREVHDRRRSAGPRGPRGCSS